MNAISGAPVAEIVEIPRLALHVHVVARLRNLIVEGHIAPGAKLNERELCERLKVSRTPLREAIKLLAAEGLVQLLPNRGAIAARLDEADVCNIFEVLIALEGLSGQLAAERITEVELEEIRALHYEMLACYARRNLPGYYALNARIHAAINAAAGNPVLTTTYGSVNSRAHPMRFHSNHDEKKWEAAVKEHEQMIQALGDRDATGMRDILVAHLTSKRDAVLKLMREGLFYPGDLTKDAQRG